MKKVLSFSLGLLALASLPGCGGGSKKPVVIKMQPEEEVQETKEIKPPIKPRTSGTHPKEVGWDEGDFS